MSPTSYQTAPPRVAIREATRAFLVGPQRSCCGSAKMGGMDLIDRYEEAAAEFTDRLDAVTDDQWSNPTPCTDWDVRQLVDHVITIQRQIPDSLDVPVGGNGADPRSMWTAVRGAALTALRQPGVMNRTITGLRGEMPVGMALVPRLSDLHVHTWDLARATGGDEHLSPENAAFILERLQPNDAALRESGSFGPKIDPPPGADAQVELLCFLGRRP
jgi:uncharacterized protein (TIGR03086 family)